MGSEILRDLAISTLRGFTEWSDRASGARALRRVLQLGLVGGAIAAALLAWSPSAQPLAATEADGPSALAEADLDADGAPDLVVGYASHGTGIVTVQRGNPDAFAPERQSVFARMQRGYEPDLMALDARVVRVPEAVSFVEAGDFNRDRRADVLAGALGGGLYLLAGDGSGGVGPARRISLGGAVTALAAGEFRAADGHLDVAVGVVRRQGPELLLYDGA